MTPLATMPAATVHARRMNLDASCYVGLPDHWQGDDTLKRELVLAALTGIATVACSTAPVGPAPGGAAREIEAVVLHPIVDAHFVVNEHYDGQYSEPGDALGSDCIAMELVEEEGRRWLRPYRGDGSRNEDWYGWEREVLAPITGTVLRVHVNPTENEPGIMGQGMSTFVIVRSDDGTHVLIAHLRDPRVQVGDQVVAGLPLGLMGNNGFSRHPHIHLGAWRGTRPLQIRFDQRAMARLHAAAQRE